jgi:hypothetical protein
MTMQFKIAFYKGRARLFNRLVSWWTRGPYSHCELVVGELNAGALCWSSSYLDGGVRLKVIPLDPAHWDIVPLHLTPGQEAAAAAWFRAHEGQPYDVRGLIGCVWQPFADDKAAWFCNEAIAAALGVEEPWRFNPNSLYEAVALLNRSGAREAFTY